MCGVMPWCGMDGLPGLVAVTRRRPHSQPIDRSSLLQRSHRHRTEAHSATQLGERHRGFLLQSVQRGQRLL